MSRLSISARLAVLSALSLTALLVLVGIVVHQQLGAGLRSGIDQQLADAALSLPSDLEEAADPSEAADDEGDEDVDEDDRFGALELSDRLVQLVDAQGRLVTSSGETGAGRPLLGPAGLERAREGGSVLRTVAEGDDPGNRWRVLAVPYGDDGHVAIIAAELEEVQDAQQALVAVYVPVALLGIVLAGALGYLIARRGLAPVRRMAREAESIGGSDLSRRLSPPARLDEVGRLTRTLNGMLDRLDAAIGRERAFTADASHELRTPLAIMRAEVELARDKAGEPVVRSSLDTALDESSRLSGLVDDLLVLARVDAGQLSDHPSLDLDELVAAVVSRFATLAARKGVRLSGAGAAVVHGDRPALERALGNLVDNAIRHTPRDGEVTVEVRATGPSSATIAVSDTGPGVPRERLAGLFDRFSRVDDARHEPGGAGLGLAIVTAVAAAHSGRVAAVNRPEGGLRVELSIAG